MSLLLFVVVLPPVPQRAIGQISLPTDGMTVTRSFDSFDGSGFSPAPSEGQLDSENFVVTGLSDGDLSFGDVATSGDFARGGSGGGVTIGGIYAFETATGNFSVGVQPTGSDFTPGAFVAQYRNDTEGTVTSVDLTYEINVFNDAQRANSFEAAYAIGACGSTPDGDFSSLPSLDYTTPGVADGSPSWSSTTRSSTASVNLSAGECLFLRFTSDDVSGSGSRDEIALDGLSVTPQQAPRVRFTAAGGSVSEADGSTTLTAEIVNPDGNPVSVSETVWDARSDQCPARAPRQTASFKDAYTVTP